MGELIDLDVERQFRADAWKAYEAAIRDIAPVLEDLQSASDDYLLGPGPDTAETLRKAAQAILVKLQLSG